MSNCFFRLSGKNILPKVIGKQMEPQEEGGRGRIGVMLFTNTRRFAQAISGRDAKLLRN